MVEKEDLEENDGQVIEKNEKGKGTDFEPVITDSHHVFQVLEENGIRYEGEIELKNIGFCKIEAQQDCLTGSFCIPKLLDIQGSRYRILFFITHDKVVLVDDDGFSQRLVKRISRRKSNQYKTKEIFLFNFIAEFMNRDQEQLAQFEKMLMELENGYPGVIILSIIVVIACIVIFKIKNIF